MNELPDGWSEVPLADLSHKIGSGSTPTGGKTAYKEAGVPLIRSMNIHFSGFTDKGLAFLDEQQAKKLESVTVLPGDVLLNITGASIGRVAIAPARMNGARVNQHVAIIRLADGIQNEFVSGYLSSPHMQRIIGQENYGVTRQALTKLMIEKFQIPIPPLYEQKRIVAKLDALSANSRRARDQIEHVPRLVEKYKQAILANSFRGDMTRAWRLSNLSKQSNDASIGSVTPASISSRKSKASAPLTPDQSSRMWDVPREWRWAQVGACAFVTKLAGFEYTKFVTYRADGDLNVLKAENAGPNGFRPTEYSRVRSADVSMLTRSQLQGGDLLVVFVGAVGNVALVPEGQKFFLGPNIGMVRPNPDIISSRYMELFFRSSEGKQLLLATSKAVTQPSLSMGAIRSTPIAIPALAEQGEIVRRIEIAFDWIDRLALETASARKLIDHLDQAILARAFRGELVPQDPNDEPASVLLERIRAEREAKSSIKRPTIKKK